MRPTIIAYAASLVCVAVGVGIRVLLAPVLQGQTPYISVFIALAFIAYRFGVGPAVVSMFAGAVGIGLLIFDPPFSFSNANHLAGFTVYFIVSSALIAVLNLLSQTQRRTNEERERLQQEVLARQKAEATQAIASTRLRMAAEAVNGIIYEFDFQSQTVERTRGLYEVLGHRPEEVAATAQWWFDQIHPDDLKIFEPRLKASMASGESLLLEYRVRHKDGHWLDIEDRAIVVADNSGKLSKIFGCAVNITERKRAERALQESESILRNIYESSPLMMGLVEVLDDDSDILHVYDSPAVDRFLGTGEGTTYGKLASENGVPPHIIALWVSNYRACQRTMKPVRFEYEHVAESGSVWLSCVVTCIGEHGSGRTRFSYISEDITERKQAEEILQTERSRLALGVQVAGLAIAELDYTTGLTHLSAEAAHLFGFGEKATVVQRDAILNAFHPEDRQAIAERIEEILKPDGPGWFAGVHRVMWPSGEVRWLRVRKQVFFKGEGEQRRAVRATLAALDVTAERDAADAMMASEQFVRGVLNSLPEHVVVLNNKGSVLAFNEPWERFSDSNGGLRQSVSEGADYLEVCRIAADQGDPYAKAAFNGLQAVIDSRSQSFTLEYPCHSQELERWFFMHAQRTQFGPAGVILSHIDITDRVLAENRLRESQDRLFQALDAAHMICFEWDIARNEVRRSFSGTSALPKTEEDRPWTFEQVVQAIAPADQTAFRENVERALASENGDYSAEYRLFDQDGAVKWYFERGRVEFDANHRPLRLTGLSQDISARKCAEEALKESESRFRVALRDSGIVVYTTDAELRYTWVHNQHASLPIGNIIGHRDDEIFPPDQALPLLTLKRRVLEGGVGETAISTITFDGDERIYNVSVEPLRDSRGNVVGVTAAAMEITAMKKAEQRIHTLLEELRAADRRKDEFLATLAHELRNPLAPIRNAIELMKHVAGNSELLEQLQTTMNRQVGHMVRLIDDLLDVSRITSNKLELKRERVNLATIMQHASEACKPNCARSEHELHVNGSCRADLLARGSRSLDASLRELADELMQVHGRSRSDLVQRAS